MSVKKKMLFDKGDRIQWTVSFPGFYPQSDQLTINEDTTINVNLLRTNVVFSWDGGGVKTVWFGDKEVTSTSPILIGDDGPMTKIDFVSKFFNDSKTKNVFIDAAGFPNGDHPLSSIVSFDSNIIEKVEIINTSHLADLSNVFADMKYLKTAYIDTSGATSTAFMFSDCMIENPPYLNTSNVTNVRGMFFKCANLKYIEQYNFSNVTNMHGTFEQCSNITSVPYLDTHNVTDISYCFSECPKLESVPLLDFSNVTDTSTIFYNCTSLTDVGGFTGLKVDISFSYSPLTHDSALNVIDNLTISSGHKVTFKKTTFDTLTPADIAKATSKGWTIESI